MARLLLLPGLGADERLFAGLGPLGLPVVIHRLPIPQHHESMTRFALRVAAELELRPEDWIGGASFGALVAADIAHDLGPAGAIECQRDALRCTDGRAQNEQVGSGGQNGANEFANRIELRPVRRISGFEFVATGRLDCADLPKIPAHARLRCRETAPGKFRDEQLLGGDGSPAQQLANRMAPLALIAVCVRHDLVRINMRI